MSEEFTLRFGKYKGSTIEDVMNSDQCYCQWLLNQPFTPDDIKQYIKENVNEKEYVMSWGKYKNKTVEWIMENDNKYIDWLCTNQYVNEKCQDLLAAIYHR